MKSITNINPNKVLVAMSGGIDSTVVALMLHQQGYEVIGITMKTWDYSTFTTKGKETGCCNLDSFYDARQVAVDKGFPHYIFDIREEFNQSVIDNFVDEYLAGRTPNPCIMCNTHIKWNALLKKAETLGCAYIATGHYAQIVQQSNDRYVIKKGIDDKKDQSYVLWGLSQDVLKKTLLPLGKYLKTDIRKMALDFGYENLSKKLESYEICFIPNNDYREFLYHKEPDKIQSLQGGWFINKLGEKLGQHKGYPFYTIGQRKGLDIAFGKPIYVIQIKPETNEVVLGEESELLGNSMLVSKTNFIKYPFIENGMQVVTRIRYKDSGMLSNLFVETNGHLRVVFQEDVKGITAGQSAVFYEGNEVVGGGIIEKMI
ncbi:MAG: tRNA 2-thiouridine(34) synthase MnmA [Alphaproteobacteria bacterium]|nr:tRNA 2-thiouridine(34) synthase MnmA [Alphaproteobacteria bacterium]